MITVYFDVPYCLSIMRIEYKIMEPKRKSPELLNATCDRNNLEN